MLSDDEFWKKLTIQTDADTPKYRQLTSDLERLIRTGALPANSQLPGELEFMEKLGISRTTIRKSFQELEERGMIFRNQGQGTFVGSKTEPSGGKRRHGAASGMMIGVLVPNITNEIYPLIIGGIEENAQRHGACVFTANSGSDPDREYQLLSEMLNRSIDGLIVEPAATDDQSQTLQLLRGLKIPVVIIENDIPSFECPKVLIDDVSGGLKATRHLIAYGHRRIAYIYKEGLKSAADRREGYRIALDEAGIPRDPELECTYTEEDERNYPGYRITRNILSRPELGVTAIFYFNDDLALQGVDAARELGVHIPKDLSIIGHDDIPRARSGAVALTTMEHPQTLLGRWAADVLFECLERPERRVFRKLRIEADLLARSTVAEPSFRG